MDMNTLSAAFRSHVQDSDKFTRRMAIALSEMDDTIPRQLVLRRERLGLLKEGSWDWFAENGGITKDHIEQAHQPLSATPDATKPKGSRP